jgi:transcriptional antiterminator RfaH
MRHDPASPSPSWVVVHTQPHRETVAVQNLLQQSFEPYCPMVSKRVRHARKVQTVLRPLFPGYVFVKLDPLKPSWRVMLSTVGVRTLVQFGDKPALVDPGFVTGLLAREVDGVIGGPGGLGFSVGQQVLMAGGAFDGLIVTVLEMDEKDRIVVLMDVLNRPVRVQAKAENIHPL